MPPAGPPSMPDPPELVLKLDGAEVDPEVRDDVLRVDVHEELGRLARATIAVRNWRDDENEVKYSTGTVFHPGVAVELQLPHEGEPTTVFDGVIVELVARFPPRSTPLLEVSCRCRGVALAAARRTRVLEDASDGDAVAAIAGDHGLTPQADDGASQQFVVQSARSDWDFLCERAAALGMALYVRGTNLVFRAPGFDAEPAISVAYGESALELALAEDAALRSAGALASSWDPESLSATEAEVGAGDAAAPLGDRGGVAGVIGETSWEEGVDRLPAPGAVGADELDAIARAQVERGALGVLSGRGRCAGTPKIRIDSTLEVTGVGDRHGGPHYLTAVRHTVDRSGYQTEFQIGLPPRIEPRRQEGPRAPQLAVGTVDDIDDPNGWGRVKVMLPWLDGDAGAVWARLASPAAGPERGFYFIPEVGDEVVVGYLGDDPRFPVVVGSLWNGSHAPPHSLDAQTNAIREIVSRAGHRITFDDSDGAALLKLVTAAEQTVTLDDSTGVEIKDKSDNKIAMESSGVTIESAGDLTLKAGGKLKLDGVQLEGKSSGPAKIESSANLDLKASAMLKASGAMVKIN